MSHPSFSKPAASPTKSPTSNLGARQDRAKDVRLERKRHARLLGRRFIKWPLRSAPEPGSALNVDRLLRARLGRATLGLSPPGLLLGYFDWLSHVALSPGKQYDLARKMWRKAVRFAFYAARRRAVLIQHLRSRHCPKTNGSTIRHGSAGRSISIINRFYLHSSGCTMRPATYVE